MYVLPAALAALGNWNQFIIVKLKPTYDERGNLVPGKLQKFPAWPHDTPTTQTLNDGRVVPVYKWDNCNAHRSDAWMNWQTAAALAASGPIGEGVVGWCVGFVITAADPFGCQDIDGCATLEGGWNEGAQDLMRRLPTAVELSLSGTGLHQWFWYRGKAPEHGKKNKTLNSELYTELRFMALGTQGMGTMIDATDLLPALINELYPPMPEVEESGWTDGPVADHTPLTDDELVHKAMARSRPQDAAAVFGGGMLKASFSDLWARNVDVLARAYPSKTPGKEFDYSDADCGLAKELAYWTGKDCERIARLMDASALKREKWSTRVHRTYLRDTIMRGVGFCTQVYKERPLVAAPLAAGTKLAPRVIEHQTFIGREALVEIFAGCVYIQDNNAVLLPNGDIVDQARFNARFAGYMFSMDNENKRPVRHAWEAFLQNQLIAFPRAEGTEFNPRLDFQDVVTRGERQWVNVYKKPHVDRRPGDVAPFMELLNKLFPRDDDALILLSYMAAVVQHPGVKFRWAPFIQGTRGNGKSTLVECLKHALGNKYVFTLKAGMIENGFNSWLENHVLYVADDIYSTKDRTDMMEALKSLITGRDHAITLKGIDSIQKRICGNFIFMDNHRDAMKKQADTRDLCVLYCAQQNPQDRKRDGLTNQFFTRSFIPWLENGGYEFVAEMLHTMVIDPRYNPAAECQEAPETSATREAVKDSRTGVEADVAEMIELGEPGFAGDFVSYSMLKKALGGTDNKRSIGVLKAKEMMLRLGYEMHRGLPDGRVARHVQPDGTRPQLFVKCDSWIAALTDAETIATLYVSAQVEAMTAKNASVFMGQGV